MILLKHIDSETRKTQQRDRTSDDRQLAFFSGPVQPNAQPLLFKPKDSGHHGRPGYYFNAYCGYSGKQYGGLYSLAECDRINQIFEPIYGEFAIERFGLACNRTLKEFRDQQNNLEALTHE